MNRQNKIETLRKINNRQTRKLYPFPSDKEFRAGLLEMKIQYSSNIFMLAFHKNISAKIKNSPVSANS